MNDNDKKIKEYKKKKIFKYITIVLSIIVIVLELLALFKVISFLWGLIPFIISYIIKYFYEKNNKKS